MYTKEQLISFGSEKLADIILTLHQNEPDMQTQLEIVVAGFDSDPTEIIALLKEKIKSLEMFDEIIREYEADYFASELNKIHNHITKYVLPKSPNQAIELMFNFLGIRENIMNHNRSGDGEIESVFRDVLEDLCKVYKNIGSLEDIVKLVYDCFMKNDYGIFDDIINDFKCVLGDNGLNLLKENMHKSRNEKNAMAIKSGLMAIATCQNNVDAYIEACSTDGKPSIHDHLEIAKRLISHSRAKEAIQWLDSLSATKSYWDTEKHSLKLQALNICGSLKEAQEERLKWFETTLSTKVYREILKYAGADLELFKKTAVQKAFEFPNSYAAFTFLKEIQEFEQLGKLVCQKFDSLASDFCTLRPIADILCKINPLAATLLYRKMIEICLASKRCKNFTYSAKDLAMCHSLSSKVTDWQGHKNHQLYFKELSAQHKMKTNFWREYTLAMNTQMAKDTQGNLSKK